MNEIGITSILTYKSKRVKVSRYFVLNQENRSFYTGCHNIVNIIFIIDLPTCFTAPDTYMLI